MNADSESAMVRLLTEQLGTAAIELVRLRCEVLQLQHDNRRMTVQLSHGRGMVESEDAAYRLAWSEVVREACKGGRDDD